jgi:hypothetical protein
MHTKKQRNPDAVYQEQIDRLQSLSRLWPSWHYWRRLTVVKLYENGTNSILRAEINTTRIKQTGLDFIILVRVN